MIEEESCGWVRSIHHFPQSSRDLNYGYLMTWIDSRHMGQPKEKMILLWEEIELGENTSQYTFDLLTTEIEGMKYDDNDDSKRKRKNGETFI